jgi:protein-tyrosine phosphatase
MIFFKLMRIKNQMLKFYSTIILLTIIAVFYSCNKENRDEAVVQKEEHNRHIELDGQPNFRDLGGYKTVDGKTVKWGQVYRSGRLPKLTDEDVMRMDSLHIKTVINFLTQTETDVKGKDRLPQGTNEIFLPIDTEEGTEGLAKEILRAGETGDFSNIPVEINPEIHRLLINKANEEYAHLLREVSDSSNRPMVFHCSHGIHRTGTGAAILLSILGVPWETIREDYLLSNVYRKEEVEHRLEQLRKLAAKNQGITPEEVDMTNTNAFYVLEAEYIDAALDEAVKNYGSMDNYIKEGLGLSEEEIQRLKNELLE